MKQLLVITFGPRKSVAINLKDIVYEIGDRHYKFSKAHIKRLIKQNAISVQFLDE